MARSTSNNRHKMNLFWKNKFCFLLGLVTKTNPRYDRGPKGTNPSFPLSVSRRQIDTCLVKRHLFTHPPTIFVNQSKENWMMIRLKSKMISSLMWSTSCHNLIWIFLKRKPKRILGTVLIPCTYHIRCDWYHITDILGKSTRVRICLFSG